MNYLIKNITLIKLVIFNCIAFSKNANIISAIISAMDKCR